MELSSDVSCNEYTTTEDSASEGDDNLDWDSALDYFVENIHVLAEI